MNLHNSSTNSHPGQLIATGVTSRDLHPREATSARAPTIEHERVRNRGSDHSPDNVIVPSEPLFAGRVHKKVWFNFAEMLEQPPKPWLFERFVGAGDLVFLAGSRGTGKTFVATNWATNVVLGKSFLDGYYPPNGAGKVVYFAGEKVHGIFDRMKAIAVDLKPEEIELLKSNFHLCASMPILSARNAEATMKKIVSDVRTMTRSQTCDLLVFDTLSNATAGMAENSSGDVSHVLKYTRILREELGATVLFLHHPPKGSKEGLRGSGVMEADADTIFSLISDGESLKLCCEKQGDDSPTPDIDLILKPQGPSQVVEWIGFSADGPESEQAPVMAYLRSEPHAWYTAREIATKLGIDVNAVRVMLNRRTKKGEVEVDHQVREDQGAKKVNCYRLVQP